MGCGDCSSCCCDVSVTGGFANVESLVAADDELLWKLAIDSVKVDVDEPVEVWEQRVRQVFDYLKSAG